MSEQRQSSTQAIALFELRYGKSAVSVDGPVTERAEYGIKAVSEGIENQLLFTPSGFFDGKELSEDLIDPAFRSRGALVVRGVAGGIAAMRMRFKPEAGTGAKGRVFLLSTAVFLPKVAFWHEIPSGFFRWCEENLDADQFVEPSPAVVGQRQATLHATDTIDDDWYEALPNWRKWLLIASFKSVWFGESFSPGRITSNFEEPRPGAVCAAEMDNLASWLRDCDPVRLDEGHGFLFSMGLEPQLTPGAVAYLPSESAVKTDEPDFSKLDLREACGASNSRRDSKGSRRHLSRDRMGRIIGLEPIIMRKFVVQNLHF